VIQKKKISLVSAVNDDGVLSSCLRASPDVAAGGLAVFEQRGYASAASAYNALLDAGGTGVVIFAHQDVYFPAGWLRQLHTALAWLDAHDANWGILGIYGVRHDGQPTGWTYSTGLGRILGGVFSAPLPVRTLDEVVLIMRVSSGLRFDEGVEGFHMYGTDICLEAERQGFRNYVIPAFAIHNSNGIKMLPSVFWRTFLYVRRKWWAQLPVAAPCAEVTRSLLPMWRARLQRFVDFKLRGRAVGSRVPQPSVLYASLVASGEVVSLESLAS
jgi:hypothetical protein